MPRSIADVNVLRQYLEGVLTRADHHAPNVDEVALAIAGAIVWRKDDADLEVFERDGEMKNVLWVRIGGQRYSLAYNHRLQAIEVRRGSTQGPVLASFTNGTTNAEVRRFFEQL